MVHILSKLSRTTIITITIIPTIIITITIINIISAMTYHSDAVIEERLSKDKKIKIRIHLNISIELSKSFKHCVNLKILVHPNFCKDGQHRYRIN